MERHLLIDRVILIVLALVALFSFNRGSHLNARLMILESSMARMAKAAQAAPAVQTDEGRLLRQMCAALRGRISSAGQNIFCNLPELAPMAQLPVTAGRAPATSGKSGEGVEIHYADWSKRECTEVKGAATCDPATKALKCPGGAPRLVRVAFTQNGKGIRNRYSCN